MTKLRIRGNPGDKCEVALVNSDGVEAVLTTVTQIILTPAGATLHMFVELIDAEIELTPSMVGQLADLSTVIATGQDWKRECEYQIEQRQKERAELIADRDRWKTLASTGAVVVPDGVTMELNPDEVRS